MQEQELFEHEEQEEHNGKDTIKEVLPELQTAYHA
jgi:hypothetical protein